MDEQSTETNYGWWTDRPQREERPSKMLGLTAVQKRSQPNVWGRSAVLVGVVLALACSVKLIAEM